MLCFRLCPSTGKLLDNSVAENRCQAPLRSLGTLSSPHSDMRVMFPITLSAVSSHARSLFQMVLGATISVRNADCWIEKVLRPNEARYVIICQRLSTMAFTPTAPQPYHVHHLNLSLQYPRPTAVVCHSKNRPWTPRKDSNRKACQSENQ
jgi:hypothetical protein